MLHKHIFHNNLFVTLLPLRHGYNVIVNLFLCLFSFSFLSYPFCLFSSLDFLVGVQIVIYLCPSFSSFYPVPDQLKSKNEVLIPIRNGSYHPVRKTSNNLPELDRIFFDLAGSNGSTFGVTAPI